MFAILQALGMFVADTFKSGWRLEGENLFLRHPAQHRIEVCAASSSTVRGRPGTARMYDADLAGSAGHGPGGSAGDDPSVASHGLQSFLALEIPNAGRAAED
jgi:hypothetical protein